MYLNYPKKTINNNVLVANDYEGKVTKKQKIEKKSRHQTLRGTSSALPKEHLIVQKVVATEMRATYPQSYHIYTQRLSLKPFEKIEAARFSQLANDQQVQDLDFNVPLPFDEAHARKRIEDFISWWNAGSCLTFGLRSIKSRELIGGISISINRAHHYGELGYWLGHDYWGQGYATEAGQAMLRFSFETLKLDKVCAQSLPENEGSVQVLKKLGMVQEGVLRQHWIKHGSRRDLVQYGILRQDDCQA